MENSEVQDLKKKKPEKKSSKIIIGVYLLIIILIIIILLLGIIFANPLVLIIAIGVTLVVLYLEINTEIDEKNNYNIK